MQQKGNHALSTLLEKKVIFPVLALN